MEVEQLSSSVLFRRYCVSTLGLIKHGFQKSGHIVYFYLQDELLRKFFRITDQWNGEQKWWRILGRIEKWSLFKHHLLKSSLSNTTQYFRFACLRFHETFPWTCPSDRKAIANRSEVHKTLAFNGSFPSKWDETLCLSKVIFLYCLWYFKIILNNFLTLYLKFSQNVITKMYGSKDRHRKTARTF